MADNVQLNSGSGGALIATDDDGTAQHQYVKVEFGGDGTFTKVTTTAGLPISEIGRAAVIHFQSAIPTTASGTALASNACKEATVKNLLSNSAIIWVGVSGVSAANGYELNPGESVTLKVNNTNLIYCLSASGTINVCVLATN